MALMRRRRWLKTLAMSYVSSATVNTTIFLLTVLSCALLIFTTYIDDGRGDYYSVDKLRGLVAYHKRQRIDELGA